MKVGADVWYRDSLYKVTEVRGDIVCIVRNVKDKSKLTPKNVQINKVKPCWIQEGDEVYYGGIACKVKNLGNKKDEKTDEFRPGVLMIGRGGKKYWEFLDDVEKAIEFIERYG